MVLLIILQLTHTSYIHIGCLHHSEMSSIQKKGVENNTHTVLGKANGNEYPHQALGLKVAG